jgi:7-cyano-7-deazaguanine synthase in queuosine biosynthesis
VTRQQWDARTAGLPVVLQLYSGGLDSYLLWRWYTRQHGVQPIPLYLPMGQRYAALDEAAMARLELLHTMRYPTQALRVLRLPQATALPFLSGMEREDGHVPLRNLLLVVRVVLHVLQQVPQHTGPVVVLLGAVAGESSRDKSHRFLRRTSRELSFLLDRTVRVEAPLRGLTKRQAVRQHLRHWPQDADLLAVPRSCYRGDPTPCGACMACARRWVALAGTGVVHTYQQAPGRWWRQQVAGRPWWRWALALARQCPPRDWWGVLRNNAEAWHVLQRTQEQDRPADPPLGAPTTHT